MKKLLLVAVCFAISTASAQAMSPERKAQLLDLLAERSIEVLGAPPTNKGRDPRHYDSGIKPVPPPGCKGATLIKKEYDPETRRWFGRWNCKGKVPR